jgi:glutathione synthase/RimK-type ligase-like ATP-grasp enzyme
VPLQDVPGPVLKAALAAARLIGNGLYGVDVKERDGRVYVMEVNDNPNVESGVEDAILGAALYRRILEDLVRRIEQGRGG